MTDSHEPTYARLMHQSLDDTTNERRPSGIHPVADILLDVARPGASPEMAEARLRAKGYAVTSIKAAGEDRDVVEVVFADDSCLLWQTMFDVMIDAKDAGEAWSEHESWEIGRAEALSDPYPERIWPSAEND